MNKVENCNQLITNRQQSIIDGSFVLYKNRILEQRDTKKKLLKQAHVPIQRTGQKVLAKI